MDYFRANLDNTLKRFYLYIKDLNDNTILFRLTTYNLLSDRNLLDVMKRDLIENDVSKP